MNTNQIKIELQSWMGGDREIADSAWTSSFDKSKRDNKTDSEVERIINMLADSGHGVPFESVVLRFWMRIPIFTDRQIMTHRIMSANGLSGRYRTVPTDYFNIPDDVMNIFDKAEVDGDIWSVILSHGNKPSHMGLTDMYYYAIEYSVNNYKAGIDFLKEAEKRGLISNIEFKRAREVWRGQMPQAGMTERTITINLRSFANFMKLRLNEHAQPEIRQVAEQMLQQLKDKNICPIAITALERNKWVI